MLSFLRMFLKTKIFFKLKNHKSTNFRRFVYTNTECHTKHDSIISKMWSAIFVLSILPTVWRISFRFWQFWFNLTKLKSERSLLKCSVILTTHKKADHILECEDLHIKVCFCFKNINRVDDWMSELPGSKTTFKSFCYCHVSWDTLNLLTFKTCKISSQSTIFLRQAASVIS